MDVADGQFALN